MRITKLKLKNFRSYQNEVKIVLNDLTVFVGKNDVGKSSILEAVEIFINDGKGLIKIDSDDVNKAALAKGDNEVVITLVFENLPQNLVLDATNETNLADEYLLNAEGHLEVIKKFVNGGKPKVFIKANHPNNENCSNLLEKKITELRAILKEHNIECEDQTRSAVIRAAVWNHFSDDLRTEEREIDVSKGDTKAIWEKLNNYLPVYSLFQSDRKNSDSDNEVQDPMKLAVKQILSDTELISTLNGVATEVHSKLTEVVNQTLEKLNEMNPGIADSLNPVIPSVDSLKWVDVFKNVSITGDEDIPINKRGSGVKRLILLNFFRAEAERRRINQNTTSIIYAIEEPETSQHAEHQKILIDALKDLAGSENTQVILTTHSASIVKKLEFDHIKLITENDGVRNVSNVEPNQLPYPSLNEVNFVAFGDVSEEYHNELYGFIEGEGLLDNYKDGKTTMPYVKELRNGGTANQDIILTEYVRHQIHHPENTRNVRFTEMQLSESVRLMRTFIEDNFS